MSDVRIVLVEDNDGDVLFVQEAFNAAGVSCQIQIAEDGQEAAVMLGMLGKGTTPCPDIIILDLNLPKLGGLELLNRKPWHEACGQVPVVVMTSSRSPEDLQAIESGGGTYFHKPMTVPEYLKIVDVVLGLVSKSAKASQG